MNVDIVTRIREHLHGDFQKTSEFLLGLAADEIERLRAVLVKANICSGCDAPWSDESHIYGKTKCCPDCSHRTPHG